MNERKIGGKQIHMTQYDLNTQLEERFAFRTILPEEDEQAAKIEQICFPPNEACTEKMMCERTHQVPDLFLVAIDRETGKICISLKIRSS